MIPPIRLNTRYALNPSNKGYHYERPARNTPRPYEISSLNMLISFNSRDSSSTQKVRRISDENPWDAKVLCTTNVYSLQLLPLSMTRKIRNLLIHCPNELFISFELVSTPFRNTTRPKSLPNISKRTIFCSHLFHSTKLISL